MRHYQSEPMKIGKHLWRISVEDYWLDNKRVTVYEWSRYGDDWNSYKVWPRYDLNDTYSGLPLSLKKLWYANEPQYRHLLVAQP